MRVGIMQPYFFPYLGYYSLIKLADRWIVFDVVQFIRHGWIERNRILKPEEGWQYISVPLQKHARNTIIRDIAINNDTDWQTRILRQLEHYKKKAPYFKEVIELVREALDFKSESIVDVNVNVLKVTCRYLNIPFEANVFSQMELEIEPVNHAGEWALNISKALQAEEYLNPHGGVKIFDQSQFIEAGIKLSFVKNKLPEYSQRRGFFEPGLSIIDVLMFNDVAATNQMIEAVEFV